MRGPSPHRIAAALVFAALASCTCSTPLKNKGQAPALEKKAYVSFDGDRFPYQVWGGDTSSPSIVLIGFHGIAGASDDYRILAGALRKTDPESVIYAPDLRGQGRDPLKCRRGDLADPRDWFQDAHTFTRLVKARHPGAKIIWCGESMGALIALHAFSSRGPEAPPCEALILSSPVVRIAPDKLSPFRQGLLSTGAVLLPKARVSLEGISGQRETRVTRDVVHQDQVETNDWHVSHFTLRLLRNLGRMARAMPEQASHVNVPVLLLHGGKDVFSHAKDIVAFEQAFVRAPLIERRFYPESYHLLFYDHERKEITTAVADWISDRKKP